MREPSAVTTHLREARHADPGTRVGAGASFAPVPHSRATRRRDRRAPGLEPGDAVAAARDPLVPAVVVADHGLYAWGADPLRARHHTEIVQWLLEAAIALAH